MSKPDLGRIIAQTMAKPVEGRTIETITDEILDAQRRGGEAILTIGRCLIEAKEMLPHGEWLPWLNEKVAYSERTARILWQLRGGTQIRKRLRIWEWQKPWRSWLCRILSATNLCKITM